MIDDRGGLQTEPEKLLASAASAMRADLDAAVDAAKRAKTDAEADALMLAALEARLRSRTAGLDAQPLRAPGDPLRLRLPRPHANAALRLGRIVKRAALGLFGTQQRDK